MILHIFIIVLINFNVFTSKIRNIFISIIPCTPHTFWVKVEREQVNVQSRNVAREKYLMLKTRERKKLKEIPLAHKHTYTIHSVCTKSGWKLFKSRWVIFSFEGIEDRRREAVRR